MDIPRKYITINPYSLLHLMYHMKYDDMVMIETQGKFKYNHSNAIESFISANDSFSQTPKVRILDNGITEELPYYLITPSSDKGHNEFTNVSNQIASERNEIREAKLFFLPLDNLMCKQRWLNESYEFSSLSGIGYDAPNFSFFDFLYHHHRSLQLFPEFKNILFKYIPQSHLGVDQEAFIANIYSISLGVKCQVHKSNGLTFIRSEEEYNLDSWILGKTTVIGGGYYQTSTTYNIDIYISNYNEAIDFYCNTFKDIFSIIEGYFFDIRAIINYCFQPDDNYQSDVDMIGLNFKI